jgi:hypothetical protein
MLYADAELIQEGKAAAPNSRRWDDPVTVAHNKSKYDYGRRNGNEGTLVQNDKSWGILMDSEQKKLLTIWASYIAVPRLMFPDENHPAAMDDVLNDSIKNTGC